MTLITKEMLWIHLIVGFKESSVSGNKPKMVLKDSSKYVKKKPNAKLNQASSN
jgi:hypothetical protein